MNINWTDNDILPTIHVFISNALSKSNTENISNVNNNEQIYNIDDIGYRRLLNGIVSDEEIELHRVEF